MKRLYNKYGAADYESTKPIDVACTNLVENLWEMVEKDGVCPRDLISYIHAEIDCLMGEKVLRRAMKMRKSEKNKNFS
jgi:hypothetical protein